MVAPTQVAARRRDPAWRPAVAVGRRGSDKVVDRVFPAPFAPRGRQLFRGAMAGYCRGMCNLYANTMPQDAMRALFEVAPAHDRLGNAAPLPAIYPRYDAPVVRLGADGQRELVSMHWGFVLPQASKRTGKPIQPKAVNNARDDRIGTAPFWRRHFERRRCLVPATSFCEARGRAPAEYHWFGVDGGPQGGFAFAGLWMRYEGPYKDARVAVDTCTIVTTAPNDVIRPVHPDRMPAILDPADHETWLTGTPDEAFALLGPFPAERMQVIGHGAELTSEPARPQ